MKQKKEDETPPSGPLRLADIARLAGVSTMTVSRALRGGTDCNKSTRQKIEQIAKSLGYKTNPLVSIYQAHVRKARAPAYQATLAWFNDWPDKGHFETTLWDMGLWLGASRRASQLGYTLEEYWTGTSSPLTPDQVAQCANRCARILNSRGIPGMILSNLFNEDFGWWEWPGLAISSIGEHMPSPTSPHRASSEISNELYHTIFTDWFANMRLACDKLRQLGYRRIGLMLSTWHNEHSQRRYSGAFLDQHSFWPACERLPIFCADRIGDTMPEGLPSWLRNNRPDAIICSENKAPGWLKACGYSVPGDIGLAHLTLAPDVKDWTGIDPDLEAIGAASVDVLVNQLHHNERGRPRQPSCTSFRGVWRAGITTLRTPSGASTQPGSLLSSK